MTRSYAYPSPVELARKRAAAERTRRAWGAVGGLTTPARHGAGHFRALALRRWGRITVADLDAARPLR